MKIFTSLSEFQFNKTFFLIFSLLISASSCSTTDNEDEENGREYPDGGMFVDNTFYDLGSAVHSVYSWNSTYIHHVQIESSESRYCAADDESIPYHHVEFEWESDSPTMDEKIYNYSDFDAFSVNVSPDNDNCDEGEMEVTGGTLEYIQEGGNAVFRFDVRTDAGLDVFGGYKGELIREVEE